MTSAGDDFGKVAVLLGGPSGEREISLLSGASPGMTAHSLVPTAAKQTGIGFADLCVEILRGAHVG